MLEVRGVLSRAADNAHPMTSCCIQTAVHQQRPVQFSIGLWFSIGCGGCQMRAFLEEEKQLAPDHSLVVEEEDPEDDKNKVGVRQNINEV
jgi:hypothetical protein